MAMQNKTGKQGDYSVSQAASVHSEIQPCNFMTIPRIGSKWKSVLNRRVR